MTQQDGAVARRRKDEAVCASFRSAARILARAKSESFIVRTHIAANDRAYARYEGIAL